MVILWLCVWLVSSCGTNGKFFNIPGDPDKPIYLDMNHEELYHEYLQKRTTSSGKVDLTTASSVEIAGYPNVDVERSDGNIALTKGSGDAPPLRKLFERIFPSYNILTTTTILDDNEIEFEEGTVSSSGKVSITGKQASVTFNDRINLEDVTYLFEWMDEYNSLGDDTSHFEIERLAISITATAKVKEEEINFEAVKPLNEEIYIIKRFDAKLQVGTQFNIVTFAGDFDSDLDASSFTTEFDGVDRGQMEKLNFDRRFDGCGHFQTDGSFQIVLESRGNIDNAGAFGANVGSAMKIIFDRDGRATTNLAFVGEFSDTDNPADVLNSVLIAENRDQSIVARIRGRRYCILMSKAEIKLAIFDEIKSKFESHFLLCYPTEFEDGEDELLMQAGVSLKAEVTLQSETDECLTQACESDPQCQQGFKKTSLTGLLTATGVAWSYPKSKKIPLKEYLKCLSEEGSFFDLPGFLFSSSETRLFYIYDFFREADMLSVTLRVDLTRFELTPLPQIVLKTIDFTYEKRVNAEGESEPSVAITIDGEGRADGIQRNFRCDADLPFSDFTCVLVVPSFNIGDILTNLIGNNDYTTTLREDPTVAKVLDTGLKNTEVEFTTGDALKVTIKTQIVIGSYEDIYLEIIYYKEFGFAFGVALRSFDFEAMMQSFLSWTGLEISLPWLRRLEGLLVVSTINTNELQEALAQEENQNGEPDSPPGRRSWLPNISSRQIKSVVKRRRLARSIQNPNANIGMSRIHNVSSNVLGTQGLNVQPTIIEEAYKSKASKNKKLNGKKKGRKALRNRRDRKQKQRKLSNKKRRNQRKNKNVRKNRRKNRRKNTKLKGKKNYKNATTANQNAGDSNADGGGDDEENDDLKFTLPSLREHTIEEGVRFSVTWRTPRSKEECNDNGICNFLVDYASDASLTLAGGYFKQNFSMYFRAAIAVTIQITDELTFEEAALEIGWGDDMDKRYIQISCMLKYVDPEADLTLRFEGLVRASLSGKLELQFTMRGFIKEPSLGPDITLRYFAFGDVYLGAKLSIERGKPSFTIEFGVTVWLGNVHQEDQALFVEQVLVVEGYFGLNVFNLADSWIYAKINKLTFGKIAKMFGQTNFPEMFAEDGFPDGILFSYATAEKEITALSKQIPSGLHIAGKAKFQWFEAFGDFLIDFPNGAFEIKLDMEPVSWIGGLISLTRKTDKNKGPFFYIKADISDPAALDIYIDCKAYILGIEYGAKVIINKAQIDIDIEGTLWPGIFNAYVKVTSTLGTNFPRTFTAVVGIKTSCAAKKIKDWLIEKLTGLKSAAENEKTAGEQVLADAEEKETDSATWTSGWNSTVRSWRGGLEEKQRQLQAQKGQKNVDYENCIDGCTPVCVGFFIWNSRCWKVWGYWVGCPGWDSCYTRVKNIFCYAGCELEWLKNAFLEWVEETITKIGIVLAKVADGLMAIINTFEEAVNWLKEKALELKTWLLGLIAQIVEFIIDAISIEIRQLELKAQMLDNFDLCFSYAYNLTLFGSEYIADHDSSRFCLSQILKYIVNKLLGISPEIQPFKEYEEKQDESKGKRQAVVEAEAEIDDQKRKTDEEVDLETGKDIVGEMDKKSLLPHGKVFRFIDDVRKKYNHTYSDEETKILDTDHNMKRYSIKPDHIVDAYNDHSAWAASENALNEKRSYVPVADVSTEQIKRSLVIDKSMSPCDRVKRSLHNYATITNGLLQSVDSMENGRVSMKAQRRDDINNLADLYVKTHQLGTKYNNYTPKQKRDIYFWYENIRKGYNTHFTSVKRSLIEYERDTLPKIKSGLDRILGQNIDSSFEQYTHHLHEHAIDGYKRSNIPQPADGEQLLHGIKRNLTMVVTNEEVPLTHMKRHLHNINDAIRTVNKQVMQCHE